MTWIGQAAKNLYAVFAVYSFQYALFSTLL
jgi:hypothetical protein